MQLMFQFCVTNPNSPTMTNKRELGLRMADTFKSLGNQVAMAIRNEQIGLGMEQLIVMETLYNAEMMIQQELADKLGKDKSNILRIIDALEKKKCVVRIPDETDRRKKNLMLTKKGADLFVKALEIEVNTISGFLNGLTESELNELSDMIGKIRNNMN